MHALYDKQRKVRHYDEMAAKRGYWRRKNACYYDDLEGYLSFVVPAGRRVLEIGCGTGDLLARLRPEYGLGVDFSSAMVQQARGNYPADRYPHLDFRVMDAEDLDLDETFDYVVISDVLGELSDVWAAFRNLRRVVGPHSRVVITYFNALWEPLLKVGERLGWKMPQDYQNWLSPDDIANLLELNGFEIIRHGRRFGFPFRIPLVSALVNRVLVQLPWLDRLGLTVYLIARPNARKLSTEPSVSVIVPCRNERGNIQAAVDRTPFMGRETELLFVDGNSNDGTVQAIEQVMENYQGPLRIGLIHQVEPGSEDGAGHGEMLALGKGDAVRKGFAAARGEVLMILDADLTVPPEDLPKFYTALVERNGDFVNGSRLVYPMDKDAMRFLNKLANKFFGHLFSWLLGQHVKDTLCGTKALYRDDYELISADRAYFGDFDPFGDFDLLFGAAKQNLRIIEIPIRYRERSYGEIKIRRFRQGLLLVKMSLIALFKLKFR